MLAGFQNSPMTSGRGNLYGATAIVTAPGIWSTAAGTGGPLLYNGSDSAHGGSGRGVTAYLLAISFGLTVASTVAGALGITGGATTAPTTTTAIDSVWSMKLSTAAPTPQCSLYRVGTVAPAGTFFWPVGQVGTSALTAELADDNFINLGGAIEVSPGYFISPCGSAILSTAVMQISIVWLELERG